MTYGAEGETRVEIDGMAQMDEGVAKNVSAPPPGAARQPTGDHAVDDVLVQFDAVTNEPLDTQIDVGERVQRVLQGRLADLGKE